MARPSFFIVFIIQGAVALECLKCNDAVVDKSSLNDAIKFVLKTFESTYRSPQCESATSPQASADVTLNTCTDNPKAGQINRCGRMVGTLRIVIDPPLIDKVETLPTEIPINMHIRGCFIVEQTLKGGCYSDKNIIDQQRGVLSGFLSILSSAEIADFDGKLCINTPNNLDAWKNYASTKNGLSPFLVCLCVLTVLSIKQIF